MLLRLFDQTNPFLLLILRWRCFNANVFAPEKAWKNETEITVSRPNPNRTTTFTAHDRSRSTNVVDVLLGKLMMGLRQMFQRQFLAML